jgi:hypothetical protein
MTGHGASMTRLRVDSKRPETALKTDSSHIEALPSAIVAGHGASKDPRKRAYIRPPGWQ